MLAKLQALETCQCMAQRTGSDSQIFVIQSVQWHSDCYIQLCWLQPEARLVRHIIWYKKKFCSFKNLLNKHFYFLKIVYSFWNAARCCLIECQIDKFSESLKVLWRKLFDNFLWLNRRVVKCHIHLIHFHVLCIISIAFIS